MKLSQSEAVSNQFYQMMGHLFFAVAIADKSIHSKEIDTLKKIIREKWLTLDETEDEYGSDAAFQIESVFDGLLEFERQSKECYDAFEEFYQQHYSIFTPGVKALILETANAIANAFAGKNKSELIILGKLNLLFQE